MAHVVISLFGSPRVVVREQTVTPFKYDKVLALLAYLAVERDHPHRRETLATLMWPDQTDPAARHSLSQALFTLRDAIGDRTGHQPLLITTNETVRIDPNGDHEVDVASFSRLIAGCAAHASRPDLTCDDCADHVDRALTLYRGEFLQHFHLANAESFEEWALLTRERLHQQSLDALSWLADHHERQGAYATASAVLRRQIELEPWREDAHRRLMRVLALNCERGAALLQYERCRQVLERELGLEPEVATTELYEAIRAGRVGPRPDARDEMTAPTPKALDTGGRARSTRLPAQPTVFVGREREIAALDGLLADSSVRCITLIGPGGMGKTRLAIAAASRAGDCFPEGIVFVGLQSVPSADLLVGAIAAALAVPLSGRDDPRDQLLEYLAALKLPVLMILDNFEHLLDGVDLIVDILAVAPSARLLLTSREALNVRDEFRYPIAGLPIPSDERADNLEAFDSVHLFVERARRVRGEFDFAAERVGVARICRAVGGMPLAIELAAAWTRTMPCLAIADEIDRNLSVLATAMRDVPERHRSVRAAFDGSWAQLSKDERWVLARLSVFAGGFRREAADEIAGASLPVIAALVDKSLVRYEADERFHLHELLRQYAAEKLRAWPEELTRASDRHCTYYADFLAARADAMSGQGQLEATAEISAELDNVRAAWRRAIDHLDIDVICRAVHPLFMFYDSRGRFLEGTTEIEIAVNMIRDSTSANSAALAFVLVHLARLYIRIGRLAEAKEILDESLRLHDQFDVPPQPGQAIDPVLWLGVLALLHGDYDEAARLGEEGRQRGLAHNLVKNLAIAWYVLTRAAVLRGRFDEARIFAERCHEAARISHDRSRMAHSLIELGNVECALGQYDAGRRHFEASHALFEEVDSLQDTAQSLYFLAKVASLQGNYLEAKSLYERTLAISQQTSDRGGVEMALRGLGRVAATLGDYDDARDYFTQALAIILKAPFVVAIPQILVDVGDLLQRTGQLDQAIALTWFVHRYPATDDETREKARQFLARHGAETDQPTSPPIGADDLNAIVDRLRVALVAPSRRVDAATQRMTGAASEPSPAPKETLTDREIEVLHLVAAGHSNWQIAQELVLSTGTVKWYTGQIYAKLGVDSRTRAIARARELSLLP
jgi:predicted ATPase/DNA-binding SARP family transcriptional activator/DNA-binding CsgD family transcriptional regulator